MEISYMGMGTLGFLPPALPPPPSPFLQKNWNDVAFVTALLFLMK